MSVPRRVEFDEPPRSGGALRRMLLTRKSGLGGGGTIPRLEAAIRRLAPEPDRVAAYRAVCGAPDTGVLPLAYPNILGAPLHLELASHSDFPLPGMGVVHVRNRIISHRPISDTEPLSLEVWVEGHREVRLGWEFDLMTEVRVGDERVWESVSTALSRRKGDAPARRPARPPRAPEEPDPRPTRSATWSLGADLGRRYGRVSRDYNPIHMYPWTAKAFGFKRAIIHGMWSLARSLSEFDDDLPGGPVSVDVSFRKPIELPSRVVFECSAGPEGVVEFAVRRAGSGRLAIQGRCESQEAGLASPALAPEGGSS